MAASDVPVLWHLKVSNFNEKVRWALDYKAIAHVRRAALPGRHRKIAEQLTGGATFPVLVLDGEAVGDSPQIIDMLERSYPEPPLYPSEPSLRHRALELERFFDEHLGPNARLLFLHEALPDRELMLGAFVPDLRGVQLQLARAAYGRVQKRVIDDFQINERSVEAASAELGAACERFASELGPSGYLVGDSFSVADLTAASLVAPLIAPQQFPYPQPQRDHPRLAQLREALAPSGLLDWTREVYARHRGRSVAVADR